jgi:hypothetical protein
MRKLTIVVGTLLCSACASSTATLAPAPAELDVRLLRSDAGHVAVALTQPAHIAVFEFIPGVGAFLLYPTSEGGAERLHGPGVAVAHMSPFTGARSMLGSFARQGYSPRYVYVIASMYPLAVEEFIHSSARLRDRLGYALFASFDGVAVFEALHSLVLTNLAPGTWSADLYVVWPAPRVIDAFALNRMIVTCPDGPRLVVRQNQLAASCAPLVAQLVDTPPPSDPITPPPPQKPQGGPEARDHGRHRERPHAGRPRGEHPRSGDQPRVERPVPDRGSTPTAQADRSRPAATPTPVRDPIRNDPPAVADDN